MPKPTSTSYPFLPPPAPGTVRSVIHETYSGPATVTVTTTMTPDQIDQAIQRRQRRLAELQDQLDTLLCGATSHDDTVVENTILSEIKRDLAAIVASVTPAPKSFFGPKPFQVGDDQPKEKSPKYFGPAPKRGRG